MKRMFLLAGGLLLAAALNVFAETHVSGEIESQTWTLEGSPYILDANVLLPWTETLTIQPGVDVRGNPGTTLIIQGEINAVGNHEHPIRFDKLENHEMWNGLELMEATGVFALCRFGGAATFGEQHNGGAVFAHASQITFEDCHFEGNHAEQDGAAIFAVNCALNLHHCQFVFNESGHTGALTVSGGDYEIHHILFAGNRGEHGGALHSDFETTLSADHCTFAFNNGDHASTFLADGNLFLSNCIAWDDSDAPMLQASDNADYSAVWSDLNSEQFPGENQIHLDPMFNDPFVMDYTLRPMSPCIDSGAPDYPPDPDGTRTDMGAFPFFHNGGGDDHILLSLPHVMGMPGQNVILPLMVDNVHAEQGVFSFQCVIGFFDPHLDVMEVNLINDGPAHGWLFDWNTDGGHLSLSAAGPHPLEHAGPLLAITFTIGADVPAGITDELPILDAMLNEGEPHVAVHGGAITYAETMYGDVSGNGQVQAFDASMILGWLAGQLELDEDQLLRANVSGDDEVSALDAALILAYVVGNIDEFPVEQGDYWIGGAVPVIPVEVNGAAEVEIGYSEAVQLLAAELDLSYLNGNRLHLVEAEALLDNATVVFSDEPGLAAHVFIAFSEPRNGAGGLVRLIFAEQGGGDPQEVINFDRVCMNEFDEYLNAGQTTLSWLGVNNPQPAQPLTHGLVQTWPNPFNARLTVSVELRRADRVGFRVFDTLGREVFDSPPQSLQPGQHSLTWDAGGNAAGMYFVQTMLGDKPQVNKVMLLK